MGTKQWQCFAGLVVVFLLAWREGHVEHALAGLLEEAFAQRADGFPHSLDVLLALFSGTQVEMLT